MVQHVAAALVGGATDAWVAPVPRVIHEVGSRDRSLWCMVPVLATSFTSSRTGAFEKSNEAITNNASVLLDGQVASDCVYHRSLGGVGNRCLEWGAK